MAPDSHFVRRPFEVYLPAVGRFAQRSDNPLLPPTLTTFTTYLTYVLITCLSVQTCRATEPPSGPVT